MQEIAKSRETVKEAIAQGRFNKDNFDNAVGICFAFQQILDIDLVKPEEEQDE